ncbi:MAG: ferredoxin, partial [bacterium]
METDSQRVVKTKDGKNITIKVDPLACIGAASCIAIAPETFALDTKNIAYVIENSQYEDLDTVLAAAMSCPVFAITLTDENNKQLYPEV